MSGKSEPKYPKGERVWVGIYNKGRELVFIITSKESSRDYYFLYELVGGVFKKLGRARSPKDLEEKFEVDKRVEAATAVSSPAIEK